jgi:hypothetical protein
VAQIIDDLDFGGRLSLDDQISAALERIAPAWDRAVSATMRGATTITAAMSTLERGVRTATRFSGRLLSPLQSIASGGRSLLSVFAGLTGQSGALSMVLGGPVGIASGLHAIVRGAMEAGGEIEQLQLAFATLMHSSDAARAHLAELQQFAVGKPFEFAFLATQSRQLQTFGYTAQETLGMLRDFGDSAAGAGTGTQGFETFTRIAGQIRTMGRMTRGQVSQLGRAGLDVSILRQQLGMSERDFANIARAGVPAERLITALRTSMRQQWGGGMERASATLAAKLSDLDDVIGNLRRQLYEALGPVLLPVIDRFSTFLTTNAKRIASVVSLVVVTVIHLVNAVLGPVFGAMSDVMERANGRTRTSVGGMIQTLQRAALLIEGVSALIVGDNGHGVSGISYVLRENLVRAGLWHTAVEIARFANRARAFLVGFAEGVTSNARTASLWVRRIAGWFGFAGSSMMRTRGDAHALGSELATLVASVLALRVGLLALRGAFSVFGAAGTVGKAATSHPIIAFILAIGAAAMWASRHWRELGATTSRGTWLRALYGLLGPIGGAIAGITQLRVVWERVKTSDIGGSLARAGASVRAFFGAMPGAGAVVGAFRTIGNAVAFVWGMLRVLTLLAGVFVGAWFRKTFTGAGEASANFLAPVRQTFVKMIALVVGVAARVTGAFRRVWDGLRAYAASAFERLLIVLAPVIARFAVLWVVMRETIVSAFSGIAETILSPFRALARQIVSLFRSLPASLQPEGLQSTVRSLEAFGTPPVEPAPDGGVRGAINASRAAPARAANAASAAATSAAAAAVNAPAPIYNPPPTHVTVQVDRAVLARAVQDHNDDDAIRFGDTRGTTPRRPR